jgi:hypothetical protein
MTQFCMHRSVCPMAQRCAGNVQVSEARSHLPHSLGGSTPFAVHFSYKKNSLYGSIKAHKHPVGAGVVSLSLIHESPRTLTQSYAKSPKYSPRGTNLFSLCVGEFCFPYWKHRAASAGIMSGLSPAKGSEAEVSSCRAPGMWDQSYPHRL